MKKNFKNILYVYCVIFTFTTILSSVIQLCKGIPKDTNLHIINRSIVVFVGVLTLVLITKINFKSKILNNIVPYVISMSLVLFYVWLTGFWEELHPNAYRDIFFNFTPLYILMAVIVEIKKRLEFKRGKG